MGSGMRFPDEPTNDEIDDYCGFLEPTDPTKTCGTCTDMQNWVCYAKELLVNSSKVCVDWEQEMEDVQ